jgi:3-oxoadipate enol-lactonase
MPIIKANSINMYYETYGQGEPLVLIAGFSGDHTAWQNIIDTYAANYQVIIFDNRGIGQTDTPNTPYTTEMLADDTIGLLKALKLGPAHFIGASFGGCIAQMIAYKYPELTKSMTLSCSFPFAHMRLKLYTEARLELIKAGAPETSIVKSITLLCWSEKYLSKPNMAEQLVQGGFFPVTLQGYEGQMHAMFSFDSRDWLHKIQCPCLVMAGDDDILATEEDGKYMSQTIPHAEFYCFKEVGHLPYIEQPKVFNRLVLDFLSKQRGDK